MNKQELIDAYEEFEMKYSAYYLAMATMEWDISTTSPKNGKPYAAMRMGVLQGEAFAAMIDPKNLKMLNDLAAIEDLDSLTKRSVTARLKDLAGMQLVPPDRYTYFEQTKHLANHIWEQAKAENNYKLFEPHLLKVIELTKEYYSYYPKKDELYDWMLDDYERDMTTKDYDAFFDLIKEKLVPFIKKVVAAKQIDTSFLHKEYDPIKQRQFMDTIMSYIHYNLDAGMIAVSVHPFTCGLSINDVRITTRYNTHDVASGILSTIHELGHATCMGQFDPKYDGSYIAHCVTSGIHESQSRLLENYLGRSKSFWIPNYPALQALFPENLNSVPLDDFVAAINASMPSLIRTEADELTYPLHILIRYELEKAIFRDQVDLSKLDQIWADKYEEYLGIRPDSDATGILQDVHWSQGSFGYFPTYALGTAYAAQFMKAMRSDLDVDSLLANSQMPVIKDWLKEKIHQYAGLYTPKETLVRVTGEAFNPQYYIDYLLDKFSKLYHI